MTYESSFDTGERQAFADRRLGRRMTRPARPLNEDEQGYWDGYAARSEAWSKLDTTAHPILRLRPYQRQTEEA